MAITIEVTSFTSLGDNKFEATGTLGDTKFLARTILYRGEPIFKVQEAGEDGEVKHLNMKSSKFGRGERIALAARLKAIRTGKVAPPQDCGVPLDGLSVKELRARCKEAGLDGYHKSGVRKADLVAMLAA